MTNILYEVRGTKIRKGPLLLVPKNELVNYRGFRSVFGFPEETAAAIQDQGGTRGLNGYRIFADELLVDFDNNEPAAEAAIKWLELHRIQHSMWHSGGRSVHLHIDTVPTTGLTVARNHKKFVAANFPGADLSFYHGAGMFRLPATLHESNLGQFKRQAYIYEGKLLNIQDYIQEFELEPTYNINDQQSRSKEEAERMLTYLTFKVINKGERNKHVYVMSRLCMDLGYTFNKTCEVIDIWNDAACRPMLPIQEIRTTVSSAFKARNYQCG